MKETYVAPHVGAWIEMRSIHRRCASRVAPHVGAWIEITNFNKRCPCE